MQVVICFMVNTDYSTWS